MTSDKKALIILTNEAFLPKGGHGRFMPNDEYWRQWSTVHEPSTADQPPTIQDSTFSSHHRLTGVDALEVGYIWLVLKKTLNIPVTFCSPRGGPVAVDPSTFDAAQKDDKLRDKVRNDREFMEQLTHTLPIKWIDPREYSFVIVPGCHGAMFDLPQCDSVSECIEQCWQEGGWIATIGHGTAALLNVQTKHGEYLIKNKRITCYSNAEEREKRFEDFLPFSLEDKLKERGAQIENSKPFTPHVIVSEHERLITAQSSPSIKQFLQKVSEKATGKSVDIEAAQWRP